MRSFQENVTVMLQLQYKTWVEAGFCTTNLITALINEWVRKRVVAGLNCIYKTLN